MTESTKEFSYVGETTIKVCQESILHNKYTWLPDIYDFSTIKKFYQLAKEIPKDGIVLDIGAQAGVFSLMAKLFPEQIWYAFEPEPKNFQCLEQNLHINNVKNVIAKKLGIGKIDTQLVLKVAKYHSGLNTLGNKLIRFDSKDCDEIKIDVVTLDTFFPTLQVSLIKSDIEGGDLDMLKGAVELIRRCRPVILMEFNSRNLSQFDYTEKDVMDFIKSISYEIKWKSEDDILIEFKE